MTSPAPLDPGLERQPGEPLGGYVSRLEDTCAGYMRAGDYHATAPLIARLTLIESACMGDVDQLAPPLPPMRLVPEAPSGAQEAQDAPSNADPAHEDRGARRGTAQGKRKGSVRQRLLDWIEGEMSRERVYLGWQVAEAAGLSEHTVKGYLASLTTERVVHREQRSDNVYRYYHPAYQPPVDERETRAAIVAHLQGLPLGDSSNPAAIAAAIGQGHTYHSLTPHLSALVADGAITREDEDGERWYEAVRA